jgi:hypothetical protein
METTTETTTPQRAFEILCTQLSKKGADAQKKIMAHLRAVTGKPMALPVYHNDKTITDEDKLGLYKLCVKALLSNNYSELQGQVAQGDKSARVDPIEEAAAEKAKPEKKTPAQATTPKPAKLESTTAEILAPIQQTVNPSGTNTEQPGDSKLLNALEEVITVIVEQRILSVIDRTAERVAEKLDERIKHALNNGSFPTDRVKQVVTEVLTQSVRFTFAPTGANEPTKS